MSNKIRDPAISNAATDTAEASLKTWALQNAILNSANFSSIATDENGLIQIFNVGAERMWGYPAAGVVNKITPDDISEPQESDRARQGVACRTRSARSHSRKAVHS